MLSHAISGHGIECKWYTISLGALALLKRSIVLSKYHFKANEANSLRTPLNKGQFVEIG